MEFIQLKGEKSESVAYKNILEINFEENGYVVVHTQGTITIHPYAYVVSGIAKAPIGWERNGHEVKFEVLIEELCARTSLTVH